MSVFGAEYADAYDSIYAEKDYEAECDVLDRLLQRNADRAVRSLLDLGCGTGRHAAVLAARGYSVVGVDRSTDMLAVARRNVRDATFVEGDIRSVDLGRRFDAALMMFAVLGYLVTDEDVASALATARRHLESGGILLFDAWYEPAVVATGPSERVRRIEVPGEGTIVRRARGELDERRRVCTVRIHLRDERGSPPREVDEEHAMRYFGHEEIERLLDAAGFELVRLVGFPDVDHEPDPSTWTVLAAGRAH
jgi:SAM-dependent methyltransferase